MQKYRLAVCEDDKVVRDEICRVCDEALTEEKVEHEITLFSNAEELENVLEKSVREGAGFFHFPHRYLCRL